MRNRAKRARVAETEERIIEDIRTKLHDTIDEMKLKIGYKKNKLKLKRPLLKM